MRQRSYSQGLSQLDGVSVSQSNTKSPNPKLSSFVIQGIVKYHLGRTIVNQPELSSFVCAFVSRNWPVYFFLKNTMIVHADIQKSWPLAWLKKDSQRDQV